MTSLQEVGNQSNSRSIAADLYEFVASLFPICRSITGNGLRQTLNKIGERIPLHLHEVSSGTPVFDWIVPKEWNIEHAYIADEQGRRLVDLRNSTLHVVNYSIPVHAWMSYAELKPHLCSIPEHPTWIPYRTSYYKEDWGFCISHEQAEKLDPQGRYEVCIDSSLADGSLTYGECYLPGQSDSEILISAHCCHPSLANDNLSAIAVATFLAEQLAKRSLRYSYRFVIAPGTIGAVTWLALNKHNTHRICHGLVLSGVGNSDKFHYKKSRRGNSEVDRAVAHVLAHLPEVGAVLEFSPYGYDERQYCSPGFNLPVGCLMRSVWGTFPEYHTSADDLDFIHPERLAEAWRVCLNTFDVLENNNTYRNLNPYCEPQLGRRNLYGSMGGGRDLAREINARLWVLNFSDGEHSLLDIAERSGIAFRDIQEAAELLFDNKLLALAHDVDTARDQSRHA
jgi:aminopeptidase-like protein